MQKENIKSLTPRRDASEAFAEHADLFVKRTAWSGPCRSWFKQGRIDGPLTMFPGTRLVYIDLLSTPRYEDYRIKYQSRNPFEFLGNGFHTMEYDGSDLSYYLGTNEKPGKLLPEFNRTTPNVAIGKVVGKEALQVNGATVGSAIETVVGV
jgi:hypothetical protein